MLSNFQHISLIHLTILNEYVYNKCIYLIRLIGGYMKKQNAFTLAEVLITLGIIGVVAALTMPTLIQNYKEKVLIVQAKKVYSNFTNVMNLMKLQSSADDFSGIFATGETVDEIVQNIGKQYNGSTVCLDSTGDCGASYDIKHAKDNTNSSEFGYPRILNADGSSIYFKHIDEYSCIKSSESSIGDGRCATIVFDVNGQYKGPNQYGADIHQVVVYLKKATPCGPNHNSEDYGALDIILSDNKLNYKK